MSIDFDVLIIGGGLVGSALALALRDADLRIGIIEARPMLANDADYNERSVALGEGSCRILRGLGVWGALEPELMAIETVHVSERGRYGAVRLKAEHHGLAGVGYVALNRHVAAAFSRQLETQNNLQLMSPAELLSFTTEDEQVSVKLHINGQPKTITTKLLVGADGTSSSVREGLGIVVKREDYGQLAVIANLTPGQPHQGRAFERFTKQGPIALLPLPENRCALVWTQTPEQAEQTLRLGDEAFLRALEARFGYRLGRFTKVGARQAFPLGLLRAENMAAQRSVIIGNAAHTLHPIAGQGLNLALRDVADLAQLLVEAGDVGAAHLLDQFESSRRVDVNRTVLYTDGLLRLFTNASPLMGHARGAALALVDRCAPLRNLMAKQGMGLGAGRSRLARGLPACRPVSLKPVEREQA